MRKAEDTAPHATLEDGLDDLVVAGSAQVEESGPGAIDELCTRAAVPRMRASRAARDAHRAAAGGGSAAGACQPGFRDRTRELDGLRGRQDFQAVTARLRESRRLPYPRRGSLAGASAARSAGMP
jgi:hypothetical protein